MKNKIKLTKGKTTNMMKPSVILSSPCEKCGEREATHEHHTIFDKKTNKSDKNSPTQNLCALCHAKVHGISPNISELRMLVTEFNRVQKARIIYDNSMQGFSFIEMKVPEFFKQQSKNLNDYEESLSKKIKKFLEGDHTILETQGIHVSEQKGEDHKLGETQSNLVFPIYAWLKSIKGIKHLLSSQIIAYIDINKFKQVSSLWHYCGMHVNNGIAPKRSKGNKIDWNPQLRMICYKISDSFVKQRTPKYRNIYDKEKKKQLELEKIMKCKYCGKTSFKHKFHEKTKKYKCPKKETYFMLLDETIPCMKPTVLMSKSKRKGKTKVTMKPKFVLSSPPKSKLHVENRARRKAVKEFLKDLFLKWKEETTRTLKPNKAMSPLHV